MRHQLLWNTLTLLGTTVTGTLLWADTPVKPSQASFTSPFAAKTAKPASLNEQLLPRDKLPEVEVEKKAVVVVDYTIKAASVEVAWLQDPITYHLHLCAEKLAGQDAILLTGYVPNERIRDKAVFLARLTTGNLPIIDQLEIQPQMALNFDAPVEPNQALIVQDTIEKAAPGVGKALQISVESNGITTVSGRVDEFTDRLKVIHALQGIPGCTAIRYDLRVTAPGANAAPVYAAAPVVAPSPPVALVPAGAVTPAKPATLVTDFKPIDTVVPLAAVPSFPKLIGPISTAKQPSPSIAEIEQRASSTVATAPTIVQASDIQVIPLPANTMALHLAEAAAVQAANQYASKANEKIVSTSLSGLFPPGMTGRSIEPGIQLGTPVIVRASFETASQKPDLIKSSELTQTSTAQPVPTLDMIPESINHMPRLAK